MIYKNPTANLLAGIAAGISAAATFGGRRPSNETVGTVNLLNVHAEAIEADPSQIKAYTDTAWAMSKITTPDNLVSTFQAQEDALSASGLTPGDGEDDADNEGDEDQDAIFGEDDEDPELLEVCDPEDDEGDELPAGEDSGNDPEVAEEIAELENVLREELRVEGMPV